MAHAKNCGPEETIDVPYSRIPSTEDRPHQARRVTVTDVTAFPPDPQITLPFEPTEVWMTATATNPVEVSYDGNDVHQILEAGEQVRMNRTLRRKYWFREPSYANGANATVVNFRAATNERRGHH